MSSFENNPDHYRIPLEEINCATEKFIRPNHLGYYCSSEEQYRFESFDGWLSFKRFTGERFFGGDTEVRERFLNEVKIVSRLNHENIVGFHGYCDEANEMIIVYKCPSNNGDLALHLKDPNKRSLLTWERRLKICIDVAKGLNYLHSGLGEHGTVIQNCVSASNILLDKDMNAKIYDFEMSVLIPANQPRRQVYKCDNYDPNHMDPIYLRTGILRVETDIYSFGVLLLQILIRQLIGTEIGMERAAKMVQHCYKHGLDNLIDPVIRYLIGSRSFHMIRDLAYKCTSYIINGRPSMDAILNTIQEALDIHNQEAVSITLTKGNSGYQKPRNFLFPLEKIELATENFSPKYSLEHSSRSGFYAGQLSESWNKINVLIVNHYSIQEVFLDHLYIVSKFHHENILPYIGYCVGDNFSSLVFDYPKNGVLLDHLQSPKLLRLINWQQRLQICIGAARGLRCLHSGLWEGSRVVHRAFRSENIYLDENMEAKIGEFGSAISILRNQPQVYDALEPEMGNEDYMDPIYGESKVVNVEVDVYSFGVVMFEILSGCTAHPWKYDDDDDDDDKEEEGEADAIGLGAKADLGKKDKLMQRVYRYYDDELEKLIDPSIRDQIDIRSLRTYTETAYKCLSFNINERPSMHRIIKRIEEVLYFQMNRTTASTITTRSLQSEKLEDLLIPLKEINLATCDFTETSEIGKGGFGVVYKGRLSEDWKNHDVAIKRLDKTGHQGKKEFLNELKLVFKFHHQNIIPFIGYCDEGDEMILVYEYANNGSLDYHLENKDRRRRLTWVKRLKICLGAAKGLEYLHTGLGEESRVIHRDVKSGNILLDENMEAKICDFGLSKSDSAKQQQTKIYTSAAGTNYYTDPIYHEGGILRPDSDVYSFGVVMFEMLSGMLAWYRRKLRNDKPRPLINLVRRYYDYGKELLIDPEIKDQIDNSSFQTFIETAYQCISFNSKERPTMETITDKIEEALDFQVKKDGSGNGD